MKIIKFTVLIIISMIITSIGYSQSSSNIVGEWKEGPGSNHVLIFKDDGSFTEKISEDYVRHGMWRIDNGQLIIDHTVTPAYAVYTTTIYEKYEVTENTLKLFRTDIEYNYTKVTQ